MTSFASKLLIAAFGLTLATAPVAANAAQIGVAVGFGGGGVVYHEGYHDGYYHHWHHAPPQPYYGPRPYYAAYHEGYYGRAPGGYYGYYSRGNWYAHRRRQNGIWIYF